jgi:hypothetical protein
MAASRKSQRKVKLKSRPKNDRTRLRKAAPKKVKKTRVTPEVLPNIEQLFSQSVQKDSGRDHRAQERISVGDLVKPYVTFGPGVLTSVDLIDVSGSGCAIRFPFRQGIPTPSPKDLLELRFYFTPNAYLRVDARVANLSYLEKDGARWMRIGLKLKTQSQGFAVFEKFVIFADLFAKKAVRTKVSPSPMIGHP